MRGTICNKFDTFYFFFVHDLLDWSIEIRLHITSKSFSSHYRHSTVAKSQHRNHTTTHELASSSLHYRTNVIAIIRHSYVDLNLDGLFVRYCIESKIHGPSPIP